MNRTTVDRHITRRALLRALGLLGLSGLAAALVGAPRPALAQGSLANLMPEEPVEATMKRLFGGRPIMDGSAVIKLELPLIAENGSVVPVSIEIAGGVTPPSYVKSIYIISDRNRRPLNAKFNFSPGVTQPFVGTNLRLNETGDVRAVAEISDGTLLMAKREVKVTVGGCGG